MKKFIQSLFAMPRDLEKKYHRISANTFFGIIIAFASHFLFIFIFLQLDVYFMVVYNICSCIFLIEMEIYPQIDQKCFSLKSADLGL